MRIVKTIKNLIIRKLIKKFFLAVFLILTFDVFATYLLAFFRPEGIWFLSNRTELSILSDLLFLEGAIIFAIGAIVASGMSLWHSGASSNTSDQHCAEEKPAADVGEARKKRIIPWILMIVIGACLMGLSIAIGALVL